jgi:RNA 3'-terminal phosphate cyclase (ATP)
MPSLRQLGVEAELTLVRCGYYPQGGGSILAEIQPSVVKNSLQCLDRGRLLQIRGLSAVTNLPEDIARRQRHRLVHRLGSEFPLNDLRVSSLPGTGKGTFLVVLLEYEQAQACFFSLGKPGKMAEKVADEVADSVIEHHHAQGCLDAYLGDQLLLPLCLSNQSTEASLRKITPHLLTNAAVIRQFLPVDIEIEGKQGQPGLLRINPRDF